LTDNDKRFVNASVFHVLYYIVDLLQVYQTFYHQEFPNFFVISYFKCSFPEKHADDHLCQVTSTDMFFARGSHHLSFHIYQMNKFWHHETVFPCNKHIFPYIFVLCSLFVLCILGISSRQIFQVPLTFFMSVIAEFTSYLDLIMLSYFDVFTVCFFILYTNMFSFFVNILMYDF
jgi:hypothetical protein